MRARRLARAAALGVVLCLTTAAIAGAIVIQQGSIRVSLQGAITPFKLPRTGTVPISVYVAGHVAAPGGGVPDQLKRLTINVNRHALLRSEGLPVCTIPEIQPASTERALSDCSSSLIGSGQFWAHIVLPDQPAYPTQGRLLIFNGRRHGQPVLLAHIFTSNPFSTSFVIAFSIRHLSHGPYGTQLAASLPQALGNWGYLDRIKLNLRRKYRFRGQHLSYFNAGCPAAPGVRFTSFRLAFAKFTFAGGRNLGITVPKSCGVKGP